MHWSVNLSVIVVLLIPCFGEVVTIPASKEDSSLLSAPTTGARKSARSLRELESTSLAQQLEWLSTKVKSIMPRNAVHPVLEEAKGVEAVVEEAKAVKAEAEGARAVGAVAGQTARTKLERVIWKLPTVVVKDILMGWGLKKLGNDFDSAVLATGILKPYLRNNSLFATLARQNVEPGTFKRMLKFACYFSDFDVQDGAIMLGHEYRVFYENQVRQMRLRLTM